MRVDKKAKNCKRRIRVRKRIFGTASRPRLSVKFSDRHIYAQCIDDERGITMLFLSTLAKEFKDSKLGANVKGATEFGELLGGKALSCGIKTIVFDRGYRKYHGCVKAFADAVRKAGLSF